MFGISDKDWKATFGELIPVGDILSGKLNSIASGGGVAAVIAASKTREAVEAKADDAFAVLYPDQNDRLDVVNELRKILPRFWDIVGVEAEDLRKSLVAALESDEPYESFIDVCSAPLQLLAKEIIDIMRDYASRDMKDKVEVTVMSAFRAAYQELSNHVTMVREKNWDGLVNSIREDEIRICCSLDEAFTPVAAAS